MSSYHEAVKRVLSEINKFLSGTLKSENLTKPAQVERNKLAELLQKLYADYDSLAPSSGDEGSTSSARDGGTTGSLDDSRNTIDSHGSEEDSYADNIPFTTVKDLTNAVKVGYLDRRQKDLLRTTWKKQYCVLQENIFYIFKKPGDKKQQGAFYITGYELRPAPQHVKDAAKKDFSFELVCPGKKSYQFLAENKDDMQAWKAVVEKASVQVAVENGGGGDEDDGDIYEEFPDGGLPAGQSTSTPVSKPVEEEPGDIYDDALTEPANASVSSTLTAPALPGRKDSTSGSFKTDQNQNVKAEPAPEVDEFYDDQMIYEPIDTVEAKPPPPPQRPSEPQIPPPVQKPESSISSATTPPPLPPHVPRHADTELPPPPPPAREPTTPSAPPLPGRTGALPPPPTEPLPAIPQPKKKSITPLLAKILHPSEDFENMFYGLWNCKGSTDDELSFDRGQIVHVISRDLDKDNWWVGELDGKIGLVPKNYLSPAYEAVH